VGREREENYLYEKGGESPLTHSGRGKRMPRKKGVSLYTGKREGGFFIP